MGKRNRRWENKLREGDKEKGLKMSNFISRVKQAREVNPFHSNPPHHPFICGLWEWQGLGWPRYMQNE